MNYKSTHLVIFLLTAINLCCFETSSRNTEIPMAQNSSPTVPAPSVKEVTRLSEKERIEISNENLINAKERIAKAMFHSNTLWTLGQNGVLLGTDLEQKKVVPFKFARFVADMYINEKNEFYLLAGDGKAVADWRILKRGSDDWTEVSAVKLNLKSNDEKESSDQIVGLSEYQNRFLVLTANEIYLEKESNEWKIIKLQNRGRLGLQTSFAVTADGFVYVGLNNGEWGGGLWRVNLSDGRIYSVEKKLKGNICSRPLDAQCDPVTAVVKDSGNPNAVYAAIGLRHFSEQGRIVKASGHSVDVIFNKAYKYDEKVDKIFPENPCDGENEINNLDKFESEGVFGMQRGSGSNSIWIVTGRAIYQIINEKVEVCAPLPDKFENVDGIGINQSVAGVVLIGTNINWAKSLSGVTPLIIVKN